MRLSELPRHDISARSLIKRARQLVANIERNEDLARRRAERLKRHAERAFETRHASNLHDVLATILGMLVPVLGSGRAAQGPDPQAQRQATQGADAHIRAPP